MVTITITNVVMRPKVTFLDYIIGGCEIQLYVAIDFTMSNGRPHDLGSLHSLRDDNKNHYMDTIKSIVQILSNYDTNQ